MLHRRVRDEAAAPGERAEAAQDHEIAADTLGKNKEKDKKQTKNNRKRWTDQEVLYIGACVNAINREARPMDRPTDRLWYPHRTLTLPLPLLLRSLA